MMNIEYKRRAHVIVLYRDKSLYHVEAYFIASGISITLYHTQEEGEREYLNFNSLRLGVQRLLSENEVYVRSYPASGQEWCDIQYIDLNTYNVAIWPVAQEEAP